MTTMIDRKPPTSTGGPSSTPIVTVSMYSAADDDEHAMHIDHVEILPTIDVEDAAKVFNDTVNNLIEQFGKNGVLPHYVPIKPDATGHRTVSFTNDKGITVAVERF